ncbi:pyrroline-5-carboxylate reductase [Candidatus Sororendozoicomonas aggregata]|uniref:pyrroline-5-carboxylate reductase n=1 Tax=Candidatus Sororendozoicomonas aggregata TaxID=3073239 RepID=UPI002ED03457
MTHSKSRVSFIGAGNMAQAIIGGMLNKGWKAEQIMATAASEKTRQTVSDRFGVPVTGDNLKAADADVVVLCVKPQLIQTVLAETAPVLGRRRPLLISVAAGITMDCLNRWSASDPLAIVRSMPNIPSLLGLGACGLFANEHVTEAEKAITASLFNAVGIAQWLEDESLIDAVIAISGSAPAYYFLFMEAIENVGVKLGLPPEVASRLTIQTALGAATMAQQYSDDIVQLRKNVCSPNGTTEQAIRVLQEGGLNQLLEKAMGKAVYRAKEMAETLSRG